MDYPAYRVSETTRLYLFDGLPLWNDLQHESDLLSPPVCAALRLTRLRYRARHKGRDPRYLTYFSGVAGASSEMDVCRECRNERPLLGGRIMCWCVLHHQH